MKCEFLKIQSFAFTKKYESYLFNWCLERTTIYRFSYTTGCIGRFLYYSFEAISGYFISYHCPLHDASVKELVQNCVKLIQMTLFLIPQRYSFIYKIPPRTTGTFLWVQDWYIKRLAWSSIMCASNGNIWLSGVLL